MGVHDQKCDPIHYPFLDRRCHPCTLISGVPRQLMSPFSTSEKSLPGSFGHLPYLEHADLKYECRLTRGLWGRLDPIYLGRTFGLHLRSFTIVPFPNTNCIVQRRRGKAFCAAPSVSLESVVPRTSSLVWRAANEGPVGMSPAVQGFHRKNDQFCDTSYCKGLWRLHGPGDPCCGV